MNPTNTQVLDSEKLREILWQFNKEQFTPDLTDDEAIAAIQQLAAEAVLAELKLANQFNDKIDADTPYGELDAQEDTERYLDTRIAQLQDLQKGK